MSDSTCIPHDGGKNPVREGETLVKVWFRDGETAAENDYLYLDWSNMAHPKDIIAYAVTPERKPETPPEPVETLRDRVAMAALPAVMAFAIESVKTGSAKADMNEHSLAKAAYAIADAFMAARGEV